MTDESLMLCVKSGELDKAAILYERYKKALYNFFLYKNSNDKDKGEDGVQQVFYQLIKYRHTFKEDGNFKVWLYSIAWNIQHHDFRRQEKQEDMINNYPITETYIQFDDDHQTLHHALKLLPDIYRDVLIMSRFGGLKYEEIAEINNCSVGVIKTRAFRAIQSLREVYFKIS
jgi:RNA polymerase sigma factor (sigma-70 family)